MNDIFFKKFKTEEMKRVYYVLLKSLFRKTLSTNEKELNKFAVKNLTLQKLFEE